MYLIGILIYRQGSIHHVRLFYQSKQYPICKVKGIIEGYIQAPALIFAGHQQQIGDLCILYPLKLYINVFVVCQHAAELAHLRKLPTYVLFDKLPL